MLTMDKLKLLFPYALLSHFPSEWEGNVFDFLNYLGLSPLHRLKFLFDLAHPKTLKTIPEVNKQCFMALDSFVEQNEHEIRKHHIVLPEFCETIFKDSKQKITITKAKDMYGYARQLSSYLRTIIPMQGIRNFEKECSRQLEVYMKAL